MGTANNMQLHKIEKCPKSTHPTVYTLHTAHKTLCTQQIVPHIADRCAVILVPPAFWEQRRREVAFYILYIYILWCRLSLHLSRQQVAVCTVSITAVASSSHAGRPCASPGSSCACIISIRCYDHSVPSCEAWSML